MGQSLVTAEYGPGSPGIGDRRVPGWDISIPNLIRPGQTDHLSHVNLPKTRMFNSFVILRGVTFIPT